ncbi:hypothetical protein FRC07_011687 [Ceratobasidium sp. 392]|nr:hypothetical protein FRC07_011687 [Ceratobasidium sp. 392]
MKRYLEACNLLGDIYPNSTHIFDNTPSVTDVFDDMDRELAQLVSYRSELCNAQAIVGRVRNRSSKLAPINRLPREILCVIFNTVVLDGQWRRETSPFGDSPAEPPSHSSVLSSVCVYWHQITISTPTLWSYIDLVISGYYKEKYYSRASWLINRANGAPLSINIHQPAYLDPDDIQRPTRWLAPIISQISSLNLSIGKIEPGVIDAVLSCWFDHGVPGTVKGLGLMLDWKTHQYAILDPTAPSTPKSTSFSPSPQQFEEFFQPITTLRLKGVFPLWNSQAYRGLAHLALRTGGIQETELISLLTDNPQLRSLSFNLEISHKQSRDSPIVPIYLPQLEILNVEMEIAEAWSLLRLIAPGARPLRTSFSLYGMIGSMVREYTEMPEVHSFIQRSNVVTMYLAGREYENGEPWFPRFQSCFPHLRTLALSGYSLNRPHIGECKYVCSSLRELCLTECDMNHDVLKRLLHAHSIQVLRIILDPRAGGNPSIKALETELSGIVPDLKCYHESGGFRNKRHSDSYLNWDYAFF